MSDDSLVGLWFCVNNVRGRITGEIAPGVFRVELPSHVEIVNATEMRYWRMYRTRAAMDEKESVLSVAQAEFERRTLRRKLADWILRVNPLGSNGMRRTYGR